VEHHHLIEVIVLIGALAVAAQWVAWRLHLPAVVLLAAAGLIAGPVAGWIDPARDFGDLLQPLVGAAVAIILFEGGLHLKFSDLREAGPAVRRLVFLGAPLAWLLTAAAAYWLGGLSAPVALLLGGILIVTGPTVIMPMLRQAKLDSDTAAILKWEGIVNDPIGALLAVMVFELLTIAPEATSAGVLGWALAAIAASAAIGYAVGRAFAWAVFAGHVAEFLKGPAILGVVLVCFLAGNLLQQEAGLVTVTVLGVTLANCGLADVDQMRRLKEYITVILVSGLFIILSASLEMSMIRDLGWPAVWFVAAMLLVVRPASVWLATIGCGMPWQQRALVAWIAPRGIVAVAISGFFGTLLVERGFADGAALVPLAFAIVLATVVVHGFTLRPLGRALGLAAGPEHGVLVAGGGAWTAHLAATLAEAGLPVTVSDPNPRHLGEAKERGVDTFAGELLSEEAEYHLELERFDRLLAATDNDAYNALVCSQLAAELGRRHVFQVASPDEEERGMSRALRGRVLADAALTGEEIERRLGNGWEFVLEPVEEAREGGDASDESTRVLIAVIRDDTEVEFNSPDDPLPLEAGDVALWLAPGAKV